MASQAGEPRPLSSCVPSGHLPVRGPGIDAAAARSMRAHPVTFAPRRPVASARALRAVLCQRHGRPALCALPDGDLGRLPHRLRRGRRRHAAPDGARRVAVASDGRSRVPRARAAVGQGDGDPLRGGSGLGHRHLVRAWAPLAPLHAVCRRAHRDALLPRGLRLLHRGDLPRHLSLRLGQGLAAAPPRLGVHRRRERGGFGVLRHAGPRLDERPRRLFPRRRSPHRDRSAHRHVPARLCARGRARPALELHRDGLHRRRHPRPRPRAPRRAEPADQARRPRGTIPDREGSALAHRRAPGRERAHDARRARDPARALASRLPRSRRRGEGTRRVPPQGLAQGRTGARRLPDHGRLRLAARRALAARGRVARAEPGAAGPALVPARSHLRGAARVRRARGGLGRHRARAPALRRPRRAANRGRGDGRARARRPLLGFYGALPLPGGGGGRAASPAARGAARGGSMTALILGGVLCTALILYALLGGADYGGGIWDLFAAGPRKAEQRSLVEHAIGPIWEANHVWLILVVVVLFTGFPPAFAAIASGLFAPLVLLLIGIVLRGAAFTFRTYETGGDRAQRRWGRIFSMSSVLAPLMLGDIVGSLASGRVTGPASRACLDAFRIVTGVYTAALFAFLSATYLAVEASGPLREDFRRRALASGAAVGALALLAFLLSARGAPLVHEGLTRHTWSWPLQGATAAAALLAFAALLLRRFRLARLAAAAQVALIVLGWAGSQFPYFVVPDCTLQSASAPPAVQRLLLVALAAGGLVLFPSLYLLFRVFKGERPLSLIDREEPRIIGGGGRGRRGGGEA